MVTTFTSVGFGDINPNHDIEIIFTILMQFVGIAFFAYLMGNVSSIVADYAAKRDRDTIKQDQLDLWVMRLDKANS